MPAKVRCPKRHLIRRITRGSTPWTHFPPHRKDKLTTGDSMKTDRRHFLSTAAAGALASSAYGAETVNDRYHKLDSILQAPVLKKELFKTPVIIQSVELL